MGLREDAEAARLRQIEEEESKKLEVEERQRRALENRRLEEEEDARESAENLGIVLTEDKGLWIADPPVDGYTPRYYLFLRSDDGVWLRYMNYQQQDRWMVVQKCPVDDHWITPVGWAFTLAQIGTQLQVMDAVLRHHLETCHPSTRVPA